MFLLCSIVENIKYQKYILLQKPGFNIQNGKKDEESHFQSRLGKKCS